MEPHAASKDRAGGEFAIFFEESLDLLCVAGFDGYFKRLNPAWTRRLGWTIDDLLAQPFVEFVHPADRDATIAEVSHLADGTQTIRFENRYRASDGSYHWLQWNARPSPHSQRIYADRSRRHLTKAPGTRDPRHRLIERRSASGRSYTTGSAKL